MNSGLLDSLAKVFFVFAICLILAVAWLGVVNVIEQNHSKVGTFTIGPGEKFTVKNGIGVISRGTIDPNYSGFEND